jgi:hypothetical protein
VSYIGNVPTSATFAIDTFNGNGVTLNFTLREAPVSTSSILVFVGGVRQATDTYTLSGSTLTFTEAPPIGTNNIQVLFLGLGASPHIPSDGSVSTLKIIDGAVTADKLAATSVSAGNYGSTTQIPSLSIDAQGRITYAANVAVSIPTQYETANAIPTMLMLSGM